MNTELINLHGRRAVRNTLDWHIEALREGGGYELHADIYGDLINAVLNMKLPPTLTLDPNDERELEAAAWCLLGVSLANKIILKPELKSALITAIKEHSSWILGTEDGCANKP